MKSTGPCRRSGAALGCVTRSAGSADEGPLAHPRFNEPPALRLYIAARHGGEVQVQPLGEDALGRETLRDGETPGPNIVGDGLDDGEVMRLAPAPEVGRPSLRRDEG